MPDPAIQPLFDSPEYLTWCTRCGQPTRWDGRQWVPDPDPDEDASNEQ